MKSQAVIVAAAVGNPIKDANGRFIKKDTIAHIEVK